MLIQFVDCYVHYKDEVLFTPEMGAFDMAVGKEIVSAFAGAADNYSFETKNQLSSTKTIQIKVSEEEKELNDLYLSVRKIRQEKKAASEENQPKNTFKKVKENHKNDWLLPLEIYELVSETNKYFSEEIISHLNTIKTNRPKVSKLIDNGLSLI